MPSAESLSYSRAQAPPVRGWYAYEDGMLGCTVLIGLRPRSRVWVLRSHKLLRCCGQASPCSYTYVHVLFFNYFVEWRKSGGGERRRQMKLSEADSKTLEVLPVYGIIVETQLWLWFGPNSSSVHNCSSTNYRST